MNINLHRILVAEDNLALSSVVQFNLKSAGYDVTVANNGAEAYELAQTNQFDLVITDHQMPGMSGVVLVQNLRSLPDYQYTPVIMLTAKTLELDTEHINNQLRVDRIIPKPFSPTRLVEAVAEVVQKRRLTNATT